MNNAEHILFNVAAAVFEELGFLLPTPTLSDEQNQAPLADGVAIGFNGATTGVLTVRLTAELEPILAANMLGADDAVAPALQRDALGELANVLCGNLLPKLAGARAAFTIGAPRFLDGPFVPSTGLERLAAIEIGVETGRAKIELFIERDPL